MLIILCPNYNRATYEFNRYVREHKSLVKHVNQRLLRVSLISGAEYQFMSEQSSQDKFKGYHADFMYIDGFIKEQTDELDR